MSGADDVLKEVEKQYGKNVASKGITLPAVDRIPTGIFPFDLASGGGFPTGRASIVFGPESSLKTTLALRAIATCQSYWPDKKAVFIDLENSYDPTWGAIQGVDNEAMIYVLPDYAEQAIDIIEAFMYADDVSVIVVDSLAAMIPANEADSSAEKASVGGAGLLISKFYRKATLALSKARKMGRMPTLICINQVRFKIGVMYGDPETMPGGQAFKFFSSMTVRLYGKDIMDKTVHKAMPTFKHCTGVIRKWKVPVNSKSFEFDMGVIEAPTHGVYLGEVDDWKVMQSYLKKFGLLAKGEKAGWTLNGVSYKNLNEVRDALAGDDQLRIDVRQILFDTVEANGSIEPQANE